MKLPPEMLERIRKLRQEATDSETQMWQLLRNRNLCGVKFRRQHPAYGFILDFFCHELKLVVEIDGSVHQEEEQKRYDRERTQILNENGIFVLRFWNDQVLPYTDKVLEIIVEAIEERQRAISSPAP
jgi:adenine-specific DNA-methyltransferase